MLDTMHDRPELIARGDSTIEAPIEVVWWLLSDIESWSTWQPEVADMVIDGVLDLHPHFQWKSGGVPVESDVVMVKEPSIMSWIDHSMGIASLHIWELEAVTERSVVVHATQSWSGWSEQALILAASHFLDDTLHRSLAALKRRAEQLTKGIPSHRYQALPS